MKLIMEKADIEDDVRELAFELLYWFSRFEFAMKEAGHLKSTKPGAIAQASWERFIDAHRDRYVLTAAGSALIEASPQVQVVEECRFDIRDFECE